MVGCDEKPITQSLCVVVAQNDVLNRSIVIKKHNLNRERWVIAVITHDVT